MSRFATFVLMGFIGAVLLVTPRASQALTMNTHTCSINRIDFDVSGGSRLLFSCTSAATGVGGASIWYFTVNSSTNLERAKMVLSVLTAAKVAGRQVMVHYYTDDSSTTQWGMGCNPADCRPLIRLQLM